MKSILYLSFMNLGVTGTYGIKKKVLSHIETFQKMGFQVFYVYVDCNYVKSNFIELDSNSFLGENFTKKLNGILLNYSFSKLDFVYIRFGGFSFDFLKLLHKIYDDKVHILLEVPTFPFIGEYRQKMKTAIKKKNYHTALGRLKAVCIYPFMSRIVKKYVDRIITFSEDEQIWGIKTIQICNGVDVQNQTEISYRIREKNKMTMICVSSCVDWHGYDRVIDGMKLYYKKELPERLIVCLNIVGDGPKVMDYKKQVSEYDLEKYVVFWGNLAGEELDRVYQESDIALDAMGRHRVGVFYNSSIKGKEYAMKGLPIVSGVKTEFDRDDNYPFYLRVPASDDPIVIEDIINFMREVEKHEKYHEKIKEYAISNFDYNVVMKPVFDYLSSMDSGLE